ncbi:hypothetical protein DYB30_004655 [Aphanomyces astaci]|uniref:Uncharacterized protein n=1 Tax=Aphanomyces astaci TaxID=112090 RepID=A0A397CG43_APHAT|nr:hypothetical protein DYB30_004655 [Aphanomyces astaci]
MKWNTKQESLPQFLELYEIVLQKLRVSGYAVHDAMVVVLDMLLWQIRHVTHQVDSLPRGQGNNLATVRVILECEYKAPVRSGALTNPRSGNNDERALTAREQPNSDDAQQDAVVFHTFDFQGQVLMDSGASSHMTGDATNLADVQAYQHAVVVVNGAKTHATKMGTMCVSAIQFRENEFLGERAQIDEYLVTADADDDDEDGLTEGGTSARPATAYVSTPYTRAPFRAPTAYETSILDAIIAGSLILDQPPNFLRQLLPPDEIALFHDQMRVHFGYLQVSINVSIKISADMASPALDRQFFPTYLKQDAIAEAECDNLRRDMNSCHLHPDGHKLIVVFNSKPRQPSGATASFHFAN